MGNVLQASSSVLVSGINISQKSSPGCPVCTDRNIYKNLTKNAIKEEILRKLGLSAPPVNVTVSTSNMPHIQEQINEVASISLYHPVLRSNCFYSKYSTGKASSVPMFNLSIYVGTNIMCAGVWVRTTSKCYSKEGQEKGREEGGTDLELVQHLSR